MGGVPFDILKPVLEKCTASQLYTVEDSNSVSLQCINDVEIKFLRIQQHSSIRVIPEKEMWGVGTLSGHFVST